MQHCCAYARFARSKSAVPTDPPIVGGTGLLRAAAIRMSHNAAVGRDLEFTKVQ
jgi:hypothetical protein